MYRMRESHARRGAGLTRRSTPQLSMMRTTVITGNLSSPLHRQTRRVCNELRGTSASSCITTSCDSCASISGSTCSESTSAGSHPDRANDYRDLIGQRMTQVAHMWWWRKPPVVPWRRRCICLKPCVAARHARRLPPPTHLRLWTHFILHHPGSGRPGRPLLQRVCTSAPGVHGRHA